MDIIGYTHTKDIGKKIKPNWWKTWEGSVYDGKVKSNHIPEKNLKRMKLVKTHH